MIWAILSNLFSSIGEILTKKSLFITRLPKLFFMLLGECFGLLVALCLWLWTDFDITHFADPGLIVSFVLIILIYLVYDYLNQKVFMQEKIATLMVYENLNTIFAIIAGYFLFADTSLITVGISIAVVIILILSYVHWKRVSFPKETKTILLIQFLKAAETILTWYLIIKISDIDYFILYEIIAVCLLIIPMIWYRYDKTLKQVGWTYFSYRGSWAIAGNCSFLLYLMLVGDFGIVVSVLLSFLGNALSITFAYFILKESPSRKDIILNVIITALVWIGFYFK